MPPPPPPLLLFSLLFLLLTATSASTAHAHTSRRLLQLQSPLPPPPPPPPPHPHHRHHAPRSPPLPTPTASNPPPPVLSPPASAPPPTPIPPPPPAPRFISTSATPTPTPDNAYPFANYPFFPSASPPPPPPLTDQQQTQPSSSSAPRTFPANISSLVAPDAGSAPGPNRRFPVLQALLLALLSLCLLLLSALLSIHLFRRLRRGAAAAGTDSARRVQVEEDGEEDGGGEEEGRSLKPPPMPTSSTNPSTEFLYLGTLASTATPPPPGTSHLRPGSPELRPLPPLPRVGPPSGEFFPGSRSSASDLRGANAAGAATDASSSWLSPSSPSASSPTLGSSPVRPPSIPQPRGPSPPPAPHQSWNPFLPVPPPPPPQQASPSDDDDGGESYTTEMRKSRPLHSNRLKPVSLHMKDEMIQMYLNNSVAVMAAVSKEVCLLGAARCHGIGVVLGALGVSQEQVRGALLEGNAHGLGVEVLRMLTQLILTNEEELKLRNFKDDPPAKLCTVDAFLKTILDVPFAFKRVDAMLYISNFYLEVNQLRISYATLEAACQELRISQLFHKVLSAVLNFGNLMSINTGSPNSHDLEPNTLLKIVDVKGAGEKAALLQFVVQEIMKPEGQHSGSVACKTNAGTVLYDVDCRKHGLQVISRLATELTNTKKAASIDIVSLSRNVSELGAGLGKVHDVLRLNSMTPSAAESARRFHGAMSTFLRQAEEEVIGLQGQESACLSSVREMAEYFHGGDSGSDDEARMFRIFAGVREFVTMLDRICREAGEIDGGRVGSTTLSWMAATPMGMMTTTS